MQFPLEEVQRAGHGGFARRDHAGGGIEPLAEHDACLVLAACVIVDVAQVRERREDRPVAFLRLAPAVEDVAPREQFSLLDGERAAVAEREFAEVPVVLEGLRRERAAHRDEACVREVAEEPEEATHARAVRVLQHVRLVRDDEVRLDLLQKVRGLRDRQLRVRQDEDVLRDLEVDREALHLPSQRDLHGRRHEQHGALRPERRCDEQRKQGLAGSDRERGDEPPLLLRPVQGEVLDGLETHRSSGRAELRGEVEVATGLAPLQHLRVIPRGQRRDASCLGDDLLARLATARDGRGGVDG